MQVRDEIKNAITVYMLLQEPHAVTADEIQDLIGYATRRKTMEVMAAMERDGRVVRLSSVMGVPGYAVGPNTEIAGR